MNETGMHLIAFALAALFAFLSRELVLEIRDARAGGRGGQARTMLALMACGGGLIAMVAAVSLV